MDEPTLLLESLNDDDLRIKISERNASGLYSPIFENSDEADEFVKKTWKYVVEILSDEPGMLASSQHFVKACDWCTEQFGPDHYRIVVGTHDPIYRGFEEINPAAAWAFDPCEQTFHFHNGDHALLFKVSWGH